MRASSIAEACIIKRLANISVESLFMFRIFLLTNLQIFPEVPIICPRSMLNKLFFIYFYSPKSIFLIPSGQAGESINLKKHAYCL